MSSGQWLMLCLAFGSSLFTFAVASAGDRSWIFTKCLMDCDETNCSSGNLDIYLREQTPIMRLFGWNCLSECKYICMWKTVDAFQKDGTPVPQFYGKWPFVRVFGIQEPASTFFSLLNGLSHIVMLIYFRQRVPSSAPMYYIWHLYALVAVNAWFWSIVFHIRDTDFTEMMDYFCAILFVLISLFTLAVRLLQNRSVWLSALVGSALLSFYIYHVHYLAFVRFDYGYNMTANVTVGIVNGLGWLGLFYNIRRQRYVWKGTVSILAISLLVLLELWDFPPVMWTIDAHSLWHLGTAPVAFLWYRYLVDDCLHLTDKLNKDKII